MNGPHPSHVLRFSYYASTYDEICINCGHTDNAPGGWGRLIYQCPKPIGQGGITMEQYAHQQRENMKKRSDT